MYLQIASSSSYIASEIAEFKTTAIRHKQQGLEWRKELISSVWADCNQTFILFAVTVTNPAHQSIRDVTSQNKWQNSQTAVDYGAELQL